MVEHTVTLAPRPRSDAWVTAVYPSEHSARPLGSGFLIGAGDRIVTCAHVIWDPERDAPYPELWVGLPNSRTLLTRRFRVDRTHLPEAWLRGERGDRKVSPDDVAVLILTKPIGGGHAVTIRRPEPQYLPGQPWWAFGFHDVSGDASHGLVRNVAGMGQIRLETLSEDLVASGYSGAGLWCDGYDAVVAVVARADTAGGNVRAITLWYAAQILPESGLGEFADALAPTAAGESALGEWGWRLTEDQEAGLHWLPRARGVTHQDEPGYLFRGRRAALTRAAQWLSAPLAEPALLAVTGSPGSGKSALLGRLVTTADPTFAAELPTDDHAIRATAATISCAVHAKGKTALEVAREVARAASAALPRHPAQLADLVCAALRAIRPAGSPLSVVIDAIDEALSPAEARSIIRDVILPLARNPDGAVRLLIGLRRRDSTGDLIGLLTGAEVIDLDDPYYTDKADLASYIAANLYLPEQLSAISPQRATTPGSAEDPEVAAIAALAKGNFLVAALEARRRLLPGSRPTWADAPVSANHLSAIHQQGSPIADASLTRETVRIANPHLPSGTDPNAQAAAQPGNEAFEQSADGPWFASIAPATMGAVDDALYRYTTQISGAGEHSAGAVLTALAYAEAPGFPASLWSKAIGVLYPNRPPPQPDELRRFALSPEVSMLVQAAGSHPDQLDAVSFRLSHQALGDALLRSRSSDAQLDAAQCAGAVTWVGRHASRAAARIRPDCADQRALTLAFIRTGQETGWSAAPRYLLRSLPTHARFGSSVDELLAQRDFPLHADLPRLRAAADGAVSEPARRRAQLLRKTRGADDADPATRAAMFSVTESQENLGDTYRALAEPSPYHARWAVVAPLEVEAVLTGHTDAVTCVCALTDQYGATLLAAGGADGTVQLWDEHSVSPVRTLRGHRGWVKTICAITDSHGGPRLASAGEDHTVRIWDLRSDQQQLLRGHTQEVTALCEIRDEGSALLASGSLDGTICIWDPSTGLPVTTLVGQVGEVSALCVIPRSVGESSTQSNTSPLSPQAHDPHPQLIAAASFDGAIRLWNTHDWTLERTLSGEDGWARALCAFTPSDARTLLVAGGSDGSCRLWDVERGTHKTLSYGHSDEITAVCSITSADGRERLATAGYDHLIQVGLPGGAAPVCTLREPEEWVNALCPITTSGGRTLLAAAVAGGTVRLWDPEAGSTPMHGRTGATAPTRVNAACTVRLPSREQLIATAGGNPLISLLDPRTGRIDKALPALEGALNEGKAVAAVPGSSGTWSLAVGGDGNSLTLWEPTTGTTRVLKGDVGHARVLCAVVDRNDRSLLASAGESSAVQLWDPRGNSPLRRLTGHRADVTALCAVPARSTTLGTSRAGLLASADEDGSIRLWNTQNWQLITQPLEHGGPVTALCAVTTPGETPRLVSGGLTDRGVRIWEPHAGGLVRVLDHTNAAITALCALTGRTGRTLLATGGEDRVVRLFDIATGSAELEIPVRHGVRGLLVIDNDLCIVLSAGLMLLSLRLH